MTPQHPAAPETETDANGLTEAEREALSNTVRAAIGRSYGFEAICRQVERIVAERVRVVEGERDAARAELRAESRRADKAVERANHYEGQFRVREQEPDQKARAESAEAAHEAEKAAHAKLRKGLRKMLNDMGDPMDPTHLHPQAASLMFTVEDLLAGASDR